MNVCDRPVIYLQWMPVIDGFISLTERILRKYLLKELTVFFKDKLEMIEKQTFVLKLFLIRLEVILYKTGHILFVESSL